MAVSSILKCKTDAYFFLSRDGKLGISSLKSAESQKFCGKKPKFSEFPQDDVKNRVYSESKESEMDVIIKVRKVSSFTYSRGK